LSLLDHLLSELVLLVSQLIRLKLLHGDLLLLHSLTQGRLLLFLTLDVLSTLVQQVLLVLHPVLLLSLVSDHSLGGLLV
jgi:hypothetical protein